MIEAIEDRVLKLVAQHAEADINSLNLQTQIAKTGIDSLGVAELMFDIEDQFDITLGNADEIQKRFDLGTIEDMVNLLKKETANA